MIRPVRRFPCHISIPLAAAALILFLALSGCLATQPIIQDRLVTDSPGALRRVVVAPLRWTQDGESDPAAGELVERYLAEAFTANGFDVVPATDVRAALTRKQSDTPANLRVLIEMVDTDFGASSVLTGEVLRFRERSGNEFGGRTPSSVSFSLTLFETPTARRVWMGLFDETQHALNEGPVRARQYPHGGTRWLTAQELAQWGAQQAVRQLMQRLNKSTR